MNLKRELGIDGSTNWSLIWGVSIWSLWKWRNQFIFDNDFLKPIDPLLVIMRNWKSLMQIQDDSLTNEGTSISPHWQPPPTDWVKLNVDGALTVAHSIAGCGGVIRDHSGSWIVGFKRVLGSCTVIEAEQWAVYKGLKLAWDLGFKKIILESDAKNVVNMLMCSNFNRCSLLVSQIQKMMTLDWELKIQHISREQNHLADALAKEGLTNTAVIHSCLSHLKAIMIKECLRFNLQVV